VVGPAGGLANSSESKVFTIRRPVVTTTNSRSSSSTSSGAGSSSGTGSVTSTSMNLGALSSTNTGIPPPQYFGVKFVLCLEIRRVFWGGCKRLTGSITWTDASVCECEKWWDQGISRYCCNRYDGHDNRAVNINTISSYIEITNSYRIP
jgi:hypothetical protein